MSMSGASQIEAGSKEKTVNEALRGERSIEDIAEEAGVTGQTLRTWLTEHYQTNPEDGRHHLIATTANDDASVDGEEDQARDEMGKPKKKKSRMTPEQRDAVKPKVLAELAAGKGVTEVAAKYGLIPSSVNYWRSQAGMVASRNLPADPRRDAVEADFGSGLTAVAISEKHGVSLSAVRRWRGEWAARKQAQKEARRAQMAHARSVKAEKMENDPEFRARYSESLRAARRKHGGDEASPEQFDLPGVEDVRAIVSAPRPVLRNLPMAPKPSPTEAFIDGAFRECVEERQTLRGMVTLLQREAEQMKRKIDAYRSRFGEIAS